MKACILNRSAPIGQRPLVYTDVPQPVPLADEVLIRVGACGVCRTDLHVVEGDLDVRKSPIIPGHQIVGRVASVGADVESLAPGDRVGAAWLARTCGRCRYCLTGRENLCDSPDFNGWTRDGGFAEFFSVAAAFTYPIPDGLSDLEAAPLLCAGIIGYRCLRMTNIGPGDWNGARLGIYGFGAAGHVCIQIARQRGAEVFVATRDRDRHQKLADELGAAWVGDTFDLPPRELDAAIVFAPAGEILPVALAALCKGGTLVLGGIHMSPIPQFEYSRIYGERVVRSVTNNTREDGRDFLAEAADAGVRTMTKAFPLDRANEALIELKSDAIRGAAVLQIG